MNVGYTLGEMKTVSTPDPIDIHVGKRLKQRRVLNGVSQEKLADAKNRQKAIILRQKTASSRLQVKQKLDSSKVDDAMFRFERYESKINDLESQVEAYDLGQRNLADEFAELEADNKIDDELAALKQKVQGSKPAAKKPAKPAKK